jgi:Protein of unknown function (DUF2384)
MTSKRRSRSEAAKASAAIHRPCTGQLSRGSALSKRIAQVRDGLPLSELDHMATLLGIDRARIERIHELASHVLGEASKASRWLTSRSRGLDGEVPLQMLDTDIGNPLHAQADRVRLTAERPFTFDGRVL